MLILLFILLLIFLFIRKFIASEERTRVIFVLLLIFIWCVAWLSLVQAELFYTRGTGTYGSDADYYYAEMLRAYESGEPFQVASKAMSKGYVIFGTLILLASPFPSVIWIKLANILLFIFCLLLIYWLMRKRNIREKYSLLFVGFLGFNGIINWMVLRNLKDTLFIFLSFLGILTIYYLFYSKKPTPWKNIIFSLLVISLFGYMLSTVRPWGMFFSLAILISIIIGAFFEGYIQKKHLIIFFLLGVILLGCFYNLLLHYFNIYRSYASLHQEFLLASGRIPFTIQILLAPLRFLVGPGFVRALQGSEVFVVTTSVGNFLIFIGSLMWWILLPLLIMAIIRSPRKLLKNFALLGPALCFLLVYSYAYAGTADTRTRAVFYLLSIPLVASYIEEVSGYSIIKKNNKKIIYLSLLIITMSLGTIFSYLSI